MIFRILCLSMFLCLETPLLLSEEVKLTCEQECEVKWANHDQHRLECKGECACRKKCEESNEGDPEKLEECQKSCEHAPPAVMDISDSSAKEG
jgi:hypothetical protein